jgi:signal transduction histidine kinase/ligand-binding sensor domain-containing protein/DNA-binding response OmpR family regulator
MNSVCSKRFLLLPVFFLLVLQCFAFDGPSVNYLGINQGLSNNAVTSIFQDHNGFMWFGTYDGLNRYDGYTFRVFRNTIGDPHSLGDNHIYTIEGDQLHNLWIGCEKGVSIFNPVTSAFSHPVFTPWKGKSPEEVDAGSPVIKSIQHEVLVGTSTSGLLVFENNSRRGIQVAFKSSTEITGDYAVQGIEFDASRKWVWVFIADEGLCRFNLESRTLNLVNNSMKQANFLKLDSKGVLWLGNDNGLFCYDSNTGRFTENKMPARNKVSGLFEDAEHVLWIASDGGGVWYMSSAATYAQPYTSATGSSLVNSNAVYAIYGDAEGRKWIGTLRGGVNLVYPRTSSFKHITYTGPGEYNEVNNFILSACEDGKNLWIGSDGAGLRYWNRAKNSSVLYVHSSNPSSISSNFVTSLTRDSQNDLWISTWFGGINRLRNHSQSFEHFTCTNPYTHTEENNAWLVYEDAQKRIWASTTNNGTLYLFNRANNRFEMFDNRIVNVQSLAEDREGNFWGGNYNSLLKIDRINKRQIIYKLGYTVRCIHEDTNKNFWIGTEGGGLLLFDRNTGKYQRFTTSEGLPSNSILRMLEDKNANLWLSTYNGLCKFNTLTRTSRNFSQTDGLQSNQFSFNGALALKSGEFLFGGIKGFNLFYPDSVYDSKESPSIFLTGLKINNRPIEDQPSYVTKRDLERIEEVSMPYDQAILSLDFIALEYTGADKIKYAYLLEGWDKNWNNVNNFHTANYSRLQEGKYTFKIKVMNADGVWSGETRLLNIIVLPPWYRTWWAYSLFLLVVASALYLYVIYNKRQERFRYEIKIANLEKQKEKEITDKRISFFTDISHEFRTPLTLIINPIKDLIQETDDKEKSHEFNLIYRNARRLLSLVDQLLIFRKADVEADQMKFTRVNFYSFCHEIYLCFVQQAKIHKQDYVFECENKELELYIDTEKMEIALYNLLSNAIKYTPAGGKILLQVKETANEVELSVSDTGYGISKSAGERLFEKFYQAENTPVRSGFGIGLYLVKHFIEGHKGQISFESGVGKGTCFVVQLKKGKEHLNAESIRDEDKLSAEPYQQQLYIDDAEDIAPAREKILEQVVTDRRTILVVDDDKSIRAYLQEILNNRYEVLEASNGAEAFEIAQKQFPDLVISDIRMEVMDGIELCKKIKSDLSLNHIPVVLVTASGAGELELQGIEGGADVYITKPFDKDILLARIDNLFKRGSELQKYFLNEVTLKKNTLKISPEYKEFIDKCIAIVEAHLNDEKFSIKLLAKEIGMSHSNLYKRVRLISGQSVNGFVRYIRLRKAAELMIKQDCNVNEAAFQVGISDSKYFRIQFNKLFGMNPSEYIRKYREPFNKVYSISSNMIKDTLK